MNVISVGAGAIGGTVAARLALAGRPPLVLDADAAHVARIRNPGLRLTGVRGEATAPLDAFTPEALPPGTPDVVLLAVRSQATEPGLAPLLPRLGPETQVVSLQNGVNEERIAALVGTSRTVGCVVGFGATITDGVIEQTSEGGLALGRLDGTTDERLAAVAELLAAAVPTRVSDNILGELWAKMLMNSVTVLGSLGGVLTGELLSPDENKPFVLAVLREGITVAAASGVRLAKLEGLLDLALFDRRDPEGEAAACRLLDGLARGLARVKSVTWQDFELGRPTEVDYVTGEIVRKGEAAGVPVPVDGAAYRMLKEIERGERRIGPENLEALRQIAAAL